MKGIIEGHTYNSISLKELYEMYKGDNVEIEFDGDKHIIWVKHRW